MSGSMGNPVQKPERSRHCSQRPGCAAREGRRHWARGAREGKPGSHALGARRPASTNREPGIARTCPPRAHPAQAAAPPVPYPGRYDVDEEERRRRREAKARHRGLPLVPTGDGKGMSAAGFGLALRADEAEGWREARTEGEA
jgi:hypothetical protein